MYPYKRRYWLILMALISLLLLAACGGAADEPAAPDEGAAPATDEGSAGEASSDVSGTVSYWLWDASQLPAYQACADAFQAKNPNITVAIEQLGWDDYWSGIQTGMVSGTAPDVFTNHLAKYPEFAQKNQLVNLQPLVERDGVSTDIYIGDLAQLWTRDGNRYGLPKDWDTVAVIYNKDMLDKAGVDPAIMDEWTWNAQDGGTFEETFATLTLDENGNNGLSADFDPTKVVQYGFIPQGAGGGYGQTQWSMFAASNGFTFMDELWGTDYHYDSPALAETLDWYSGLSLDKGYAPGFAELKSLGAGAMFAAGQGAITTDGSWLINWYVNNTDFPIGFGRLPAGPEGRKSVFNGLADSIWAGSKNQDAAWEWVKYAASPECENKVGEYAVVFPAIQSGVDNALRAFEEKGLDVSAFTDQALEENGTFLFPIADNASEVSSIMEPTMDSIMLGEVEPAEALKQADEKVDAVMQK